MSKLPEGWEKLSRYVYERRDGSRVTWFGPKCWRWIRSNGSLSFTSSESSKEMRDFLDRTYPMKETNE